MPVGATSRNLALLVASATIESLASKHYHFKATKVFAQERERTVELLAHATSARLHDLLQAMRFTQEQTIELRKETEKVMQLLQEAEVKSPQ